MYLAIDIGGTKTLLATFTKQGDIKQTAKFPTPQNYKNFLRELANSVANLSTNNFFACCIALPGKIDRSLGVGVACGNLPWENVPIVADVKKMLNCPVLIENDAKLAGLSEALLLAPKYNRALYITISTGIGTGVITNKQIDKDFQDMEGGEIILEHHGKLQMWEKFASGSAIVKEYGKEAQYINDPKIWNVIARNLAIGFIDLSAVVQPQIIVVGGGVGAYFEKFEKPLKSYLEQFATPLTPAPKIVKAKRPFEAVIYGCYRLAKEFYERNN